MQPQPRPPLPPFFLFLCRCLDAFSSYLTHHAAINLQPPSCTVLYQTSGSSEVVLKSPVMPSSRRSSGTQSVHYFSFPPGPRYPAFSCSPDTTLLGNLWSPMRSSAPAHNNLLVRTVVSIRREFGKTQRRHQISDNVRDIEHFLCNFIMGRMI